MFGISTQAHAENVRLRDVTSPALQAGIRAATEGRWADAERLFQVVLNEEPALGSVCREECHEGATHGAAHPLQPILNYCWT